MTNANSSCKDEVAAATTTMTTPRRARLSSSSSVAEERLDLDVVGQILERERRKSCLSRSWHGKQDVSTNRNANFVNLSQVNLLTAKNEIMKLEAMNATLEASNKRARIEYESEKETCQNQQKKYQEEVEDLQTQLRNCMEKQVETLELLKAARQSAITCKTTYEEKIEKIRTEKMEATSKYDEQILELREELSEAKSMILQNEKIVSEAALERKILNQKLEVQTRTLQTIIKEKEELSIQIEESHKENKKLKELENKMSEVSELLTLNKILQAQVTHGKEVEKENARFKDENRFLKDEMKMKLLLQEKLDGAEKALERAQERLASMNNLSRENTELTAKLEIWEKLSCVTSEQKSPHKLVQYVGDLQAKEVSLLNEQGEMSTKLALLSKDKENLEKRVTTLERELESKSTKIQTNLDLVKRLQKKLLLLTKERDSYRNVLNSYEKEVTLNMSTVTAERIQMLEQSLETANSQIEMLEAANMRLIEQSESKNGIPPVIGQTTCHQCVVAVKKIEALEKQCSDLFEEKSNLEIALDDQRLKGDYDPRSTKVVHMKFNPATKEQNRQRQMLETLITENKCLRTKLANHQDVGNITMSKPSNLHTDKDFEELKEQLKSSEYKHQRYVEAFTEKSQEFRELCYLLFGYRVDLIDGHRCKIISMYAEDAEDFLLFKMGAKGAIKLLKTDFSCKISYLTETFAETTQHSCFLKQLDIGFAKPTDSDDSFMIN